MARCSAVRQRPRRFRGRYAPPRPAGSQALATLAKAAIYGSGRRPGALLKYGMIGAYLRVSTRGQSVDTQRDAVARACKARGLRVGVWYQEKVGGAAAERPEFERLRADARAGKLKQLFVYRLDRLSRRGIRETLAILEELRGHGVAVESIGDGFSLTGPAGDVVVAVLAWAAQMERAAIGERIHAARKRIESKGGAWGRPARVEADREEKIRQLRKAGRTIRQIAIALKIPKSTVGRAASQKGAYRPKRAALAKCGTRKVAAPCPN
jgi:DNA invertase Pin-like site-specific DNA recombinase